MAVPRSVIVASLLYRFWWVVVILWLALSAWLTHSIAVDIAAFHAGP